VVELLEQLLGVDGRRGGGVALDLGSATLTTTNAGAAAITVRHATTVNLGDVNAASGTLQVGVGGDVTAGAELVAGPGWFGLRSHPRVRGSITLGGTELPAWFDDALRALA